MLTIHTEIIENSVQIPINEWQIIVEKLNSIENIKIEEKNRYDVKGKGVFKKYANPSLIKKEKEAWAESAVKKYENS